MGPVVDRDVAEANFADRVIARSSVVPVVVDFWAAWCQPCRILSPTLDRLERSANGAWELVKVDIDREPELAKRYRISSIPALMGFRNGQVVAEMLGAQPEPAVRAFLARLQPSEADRLISEAESALIAGDQTQAESSLREALKEEPGNARALLALGSLLLDDDRLDESAETLERIPPQTDEGRRARALLSRLRFMREAAADSAESQVGADTPEWAHWIAGNRAAAGGEFREALRQFLWLVENARRFHDDGGRSAALAVFDILGPDDPITLEFRPQLSSLLF
jgi:putative thioredoxin